MSTRNDKFQNSLEIYQKNSVLFKWNEFPVEWRIELLTKNTRSSEHMYVIHIPLKVVQYTVDAYRDANGVNHPTTCYYRNQEIPNISDMRNDFNTYFDYYSLNDENNAPLSFVYMIRNYQTDDCVGCEVRVMYNKKHLPFPNAEHEFEVDNRYLYKNIKNVNDMMCDMYYEKEYFKFHYYRDKTQENNQINKYLAKMKRMKTIVEELKRERGIKEECPVCYEDMNDNNYTLTDCCHSLCRDCHQKCVCCPICRDDFAKENIPFFPPEAPLELEEGEIFDF